MYIEGVFYPSGSSRQQCAALTVDAEGQVRVLDSAAADMLDCIVLFDELDISQRIGNTPRHLAFANGDRFETGDNDGIDAIAKARRLHHGQHLLHWLESYMPSVLVLTLLTVLFVWGFVEFGAPLSAKLIAQLLPETTNQYLGSGTLELLDKSVFEPSELPAARREQLQARFASYIGEYPQYRIKVLFRSSDDVGANALALPDGHIIFTDAMVELAEDDDELVAVFAHEIGHLAHKHVLRRVVQDSMLTLVIVLVTGDINGASSIVIALPTLLLELAYSRDFEREADDFAFDFLQDHDLETAHFARLMQRLAASRVEQEDGVPLRESDDSEPAVSVYWSTHPVTDERIERFASPNP